MRFDETLAFVKRTQGRYDPATGNHKPPTDVQVERMASVAGMSEESQMRLLGELKKGVLTAYVKGAVPLGFDYIVYKERRYMLISCRAIREKTIIHMREML